MSRIGFDAASNRRAAVEANPNAGPRELGEFVGSSAPTVRRMLTALDRAGILAAIPAPAHRDGCALALAAHGWALLADKYADMEARRAPIAVSLTVKERHQIERMLLQLADSLDALWESPRFVEGSVMQLTVRQ